MYKLLLCWRYLRTRYLAMVCIVSVMLGVATLIVVNSVMGGFSTKLRERLHALLSDVCLEAHDYDGFRDPEGKMRLIRSDPFLSKHVQAMAPTLEIFAMIQFTYNGYPMARPIRLIGIDPEQRAVIGGFAEYLVHNRAHPTFALSAAAKKRYDDNHRPHGLFLGKPVEDFPPLPGEKPAPDPPPSKPFVPEGVIIGHAIAHARRHLKDEHNNVTAKTEEVQLLAPGDDVIITTVSGAIRTLAGTQNLTPVYARFAVADYFRSEMSEYDGNYAFVPLDYLQRLRTMEDRVTSIQIRLRDESHKKEVVKRLEELFRGSANVLTWEDKQGPLLAAISVEKGILNVLLFLIIAVAGFGILAIFSMIVVEKTRDIGILKALGASNGGVLKIFLGYGLLLGVVGALLGTGLGVTITVHINWIEHLLSRITGQEIFPRDVYYFDRIPTDIRVAHVALVNVGAVAIAVLFSVLPALRAALLHPVRALRFE
jgi:lipoprotein-releasing system permease protein